MCLPTDQPDAHDRLRCGVRWSLAGSLALFLLLSGLGMASCGRPQQQELPPPGWLSGETELVWPVVRVGPDGEDAPRLLVRLRTSADGRYRYSWLDLESEHAAWQHTEGSWAAAQGDSTGWTLRPDDGRAGLRPGDFRENEWPVVSWLARVPAGARGAYATARYRVPHLDTRSRQLTSDFHYADDPREPQGQSRGMADRVLGASD